MAPERRGVRGAAAGGRTGLAAPREACTKPPVMRSQSADLAALEEEHARSRARRALVAATVHRRRFAAVLGLGGGQGPQGKKHKSQGGEFSWDLHVLRLTEAEFKLRYRLDFDSFMELLSLLRKDLEPKSEKMARLAKGGELIVPEVRLAVALRFLAGGSPLDLKLIYKIEKMEVYRCVWRVVDAVNRRLDNITFPLDDVEKLKVLEAEFRAASRGGIWEGQVGAVDGICFKMRAQSANESEMLFPSLVCSPQPFY